MEAGSETTDGSAHVTGSATTLQKRGSDGQTWSYDWGGSFLTSDAPYSTSWISQYSGLSYSAN